MNSKEHNEIYNLYQSIYQEQIDENLLSNVERLSDKYVRPTVGNLGAQKGRDKMGNLPILGDIGARQGRNRATGMYDKTKGQLKSGKIGGAIKTARSALETLTRENYDTIKGHLMSEGYADTEEAAVAIMANMSEEWRQSIVEGPVGEFADGVARTAGTVVGKIEGAPRYLAQKAKNVKSTFDTARERGRSGTSNARSSSNGTPGPSAARRPPAQKVPAKKGQVQHMGRDL
tara:strand:+ start:533 stop:1225 length:693 start_codon:yes stop_codon:yes gene_type:complete